MCKMVFRIRSIVAYTWHMETNQITDSAEAGSQNPQLDKIKALYNEDFTFIKMNEIVRQNMVNLFEGTDSEQNILEDKKGGTLRTGVKNTPVNIDIELLQPEENKTFEDISLMHSILTTLSHFDLYKTKNIEEKVEMHKLSEE